MSDTAYLVTLPSRQIVALRTPGVPGGFFIYRGIDVHKNIRRESNLGVDPRFVDVGIAGSLALAEFLR
jgi:hypothetical protein